MSLAHLHQAFEKKGGAFDPVDAPAEVQKILEAFSQRADAMIQAAKAKSIDRRLDEVVFGFVANFEVNAWATVFDGRPTIGISMGAVVQMMRTVDVLLSHARVLPHIGAPEDRTDRISITPDSNFARNYLNGYETWPRPADRDRTAYSERLLEIALDFLAGHELGHLAHGHWDLLNRDHGITEVGELEALGNRAVSDLDRQLFELDADTLGTFAVLKWAHDPVALTYALHGLFKQFHRGGVPLSLADALVGTHPPPYFRSRFVQGAAVSMLKTLRPAPNFLQETARALVECETAFGNATSGEAVGSWFTEDAGALMKTTFDHLVGGLPDLRSRLHPLRRAAVLTGSLAGWEIL